VRDLVGDVAQQELLAAGHPDVPHDQHVDRFLLGRADDGHRRIGVDDHPGPAASAGHLIGQLRQLLLGFLRQRRLGVGGIRTLLGVRDHDLQQHELGAEPVGHLGRPVHRLRGRGRAVRRHHDALDQRASQCRGRRTA
jgi:hypothetical protein